jgi:hypothetical protein
MARAGGKKRVLRPPLSGWIVAASLVSIGLLGLGLVTRTIVGGMIGPANSPEMNLVQNPSLEAATGSTPTCWHLGGYGTNTFAWSRTADAHTGRFAENLNVTDYTNGDRKFVTAQDSGACAPTISAGQTYAVSAWYKATLQPYIFVYTRNNVGVWAYWTQSPRLTIASDWTRASFITPVVPPGTTNISIGLGVDGIGSLTMDDFGLAPASTPSSQVPIPTASGSASTFPCGGSACPSDSAQSP